MLSRFAIVCVACQRVMQPHETGVLVVDGEGTHREYKFFADVKKCPGCGTKVLSGFGAPIYPNEEGYAELNNPKVKLV